VRTATLIGGMAASVALAAAAVAQPAFEFIPTPPGAQLGDINSRVWGVSSDGRTVAGTVSGPSGLRGWRWRSGIGRADYGPPTYPYNSIAVTGLSGDGTAVVGEVIASGVNTLFRSVNDGAFDIYTVPTGYDGLAFARTNRDGSVVVSNATIEGPSGEVVGNRAVRHSSPSAFEFVPAPTGADLTLHSAVDVSDTSRIVGGTRDTTRSNQGHAWVWDDASGARWLPVTSNSIGSTASSISRNGAFIAGEMIEPGQRPQLARWSGSELMTFQMPATPAHVGLIAASISNDGSIITGTLFGNGSTVGDNGFVWTPSTGIMEATAYLVSIGVVFPNSPTLRVRAVGQTIVSADGSRLSGLVDYINPQTNRVTLQFFTVAIPSPSTLLLAAVGSIVCIRRRRSRSA
jgi:hypothetical protein